MTWTNVKLDIVSITRPRGTNYVSFGVAGKKCDSPGHATSYFSVPLSGHAVACDRGYYEYGGKWIPVVGCAPECRKNVPFWLRFLADGAWHARSKGVV